METGVARSLSLSDFSFFSLSLFSLFSDFFFSSVGSDLCLWECFLTGLAAEISSEVLRTGAFSFTFREASLREEAAASEEGATKEVLEAKNIAFEMGLSFPIVPEGLCKEDVRDSRELDSCKRLYKTKQQQTWISCEESETELLSATATYVSTYWKTQKTNKR